MSYTLYYLPAASSFSVHIMLAEAGAEYKAIAVQRGKAGLETPEGNHLSQVNPKGTAPALIHNGTLRTEAAVIGRYLAAQFPDKLYFPQEGEEMWEALELSNYLSTDLHKTHTPLFEGLGHIAEAKEKTFERLDRTYTYLNNVLEGKKYLLGDKISILDFYLFNVMLWADMVDYDLSKFPNLIAFQKTVRERPSVAQALKEEGLA
uniref:ARAD1D38676p n=1 Tax=Blastobotrys adeninivorans TaxID=409370 RepID=A0A060TIH8_BLAAD